MKRYLAPTILLLFGIILATPGVQATGRHGFGFNAGNITGISGSVFLTGGGAFSLPDFIHSGGGFSCTSSVSAGLFANDLNTKSRLEKGPGCQTGEEYAGTQQNY